MHDQASREAGERQVMGLCRNKTGLRREHVSQTRARTHTHTHTHKHRGGKIVEFFENQYPKDAVVVTPKLQWRRQSRQGCHLDTAACSTVL